MLHEPDRPLSKMQLAALNILFIRRQKRQIIDKIKVAVGPHVRAKAVV